MRLCLPSSSRAPATVLAVMLNTLRLLLGERPSAAIPCDLIAIHPRRLHRSLAKLECVRFRWQNRRTRGPAKMTSLAMALPHLAHRVVSLLRNNSQLSEAQRTLASRPPGAFMGSRLGPPNGSVCPVTYVNTARALWSGSLSKDEPAGQIGMLGSELGHCLFPERPQQTHLIMTSHWRFRMQAE
jgi:hypothetical protein